MATKTSKIAPKEGGITISPKQKKTLITVLVAIVVIVGGCFAYHYFVSKPADEKAQTQITEALQILSQAEQTEGQSAQYLAMPDSMLIQQMGLANATPDSAKNAVKTFREQAQQQVSTLYNQALKGNGKFPGLLKIAGGSGSSANQAKALAGIAYYHLGQYKEAIKQLEDFSAKGDLFSATALSALANCYACDKQLDKAVETFKAAADEFENEATTPLYLIEAGKILESQNKKADAHALYEQVKKDYPAYGSQSGMGVSEVDKYLERTK